MLRNPQEQPAAVIPAHHLLPLFRPLDRVNRHVVQAPNLGHTGTLLPKCCLRILNESGRRIKTYGNETVPQASGNNRDFLPYQTFGNVWIVEGSPTIPFMDVGPILPPVAGAGPPVAGWRRSQGDTACPTVPTASAMP